MKVPSTLEALEGTQKLLSDPARWCQWKYTDGKGAYCLFGALSLQFHNLKCKYEAEETKAAWTLSMVLPPSFKKVSDFNDHSTHEEVMELLSNAITFAKEKGL